MKVEETRTQPVSVIKRTESGKFQVLTAFEDGESEITGEIDLIKVVEHLYRVNDAERDLRQTGN